MPAKLDMTHVPYKSTPPALADVVSGHVQVMVADVPASLSMIRAGKIRPVGVPSAQRYPMLPDVPTFAESGLPTPPNMDGWWAACRADRHARRDPRSPEQGMWSKSSKQESIKTKLLQSSLMPTPSTRQQVVQYQKDQLQVWKTIVKDLNLKVEVRRVWHADCRWIFSIRRQSSSLRAQLDLLGDRDADIDQLCIRRDGDHFRCRIMWPAIARSAARHSGCHERLPCQVKSRRPGNSSVR